MASTLCGQIYQQEFHKRQILGALLFLIYINHLSNNLSSNPKPFADETSIFSAVHNINQSGINLNDDLKKKTTRFFNGKWISTLTLIKKAQEVIFSWKSSEFKPSFNVYWRQFYPIWNSKTNKNVSGFKTVF